MWSPEDTHKITEAIYKNITNNFNHGVRQILTTGKLYHKALVGLTTSAHSFIEAVGKVGYSCQVNGQGGTDEIGCAILKFADIQKEMFAKVEECTKALFSEVILPLEHRLENDFKNSYAEHKKYQHGHKGYFNPYIKAQDALKKFRKKSKAKFTYDESKEAQYVRTVAKCQEKLTEFRTQGLKLALLEERKCYCYLLERLTTMSTVQSACTKMSFELLAMEAPHWKQLCSQPHILPRALDPLLRRAQSQRDHGDGHNQNGMVYHKSAFSNPYQRPVVSSEYMIQTSSPSEYAVPAVPMLSQTMPRGAPMSYLPPQSQGHVTAVYAHIGRGDDQLTFKDGDIITLIGEKADGWQYGLHAHTGKFGWFPLSFTESSNQPVEQSHQLQRAKSIGDLLDSRSQISDISISYELEMPGRSRRPQSVYEGPLARNITPTPHTVPTSQPSPNLPWSGVSYHNSGGDYAVSPITMHSTGVCSDTSLQPSSGFHTLPRPSPHADLGSQDLYQTVSDHSYDHKMSASSSHELSGAQTMPRGHEHPLMNLHRSSQHHLGNQSPQAPPPPPPPISDHQQQNGAASPSFPPPPPPTEFTDDADQRIENLMFSNVSLRKTKTNDRSAPRL